MGSQWAQPTYLPGKLVQFPPRSGFPSRGHAVQFDKQSHVNSKHLIYFCGSQLSQEKQQAGATKKFRPAGLTTQTAPTRTHGHHPPSASSPCCPGLPLLEGCGGRHCWESCSPQARLPCCLFLTTCCGSQPADLVLFSPMVSVRNFLILKK